MYINKKEMIFSDNNLTLWIKENSIWSYVRELKDGIIAINLLGSNFHFVDESNLKNFIKILKDKVNKEVIL